MSFKTISIVVISVAVTVILMNNTDEIDFWIFGDAKIPKLAILGSMFGLGLIVGFLAGRPKARAAAIQQDEEKQPPYDGPERNQLSDEDREYIR